MNTIQFSDSQMNAIYFLCLALLHNPLSKEEKTTALEEVLISSLLMNKLPLVAIQSGLDLIDTSINSYSSVFADKLRSGEVVKVSTGSKIIDDTFQERIDSLLKGSFGQ